MWLRLLTTALLVFSISLLFLNGIFVGAKPGPKAPRVEKINYLKRSAAFLLVEAVSISAAIVSAYLLARRAREEFREMTLTNMQELIEASLHEHKKIPDEHLQ